MSAVGRQRLAGPQIQRHNILERKKHASRSIGVDLDPTVIEAWQARRVPGLQLHCTDAVVFLERHIATGLELIDADPPHVMASRRGQPALSVRVRR
jgi:hypothetical protein